MYKKAMSLLLAGNLVLMLGFVCIREAEAARLTTQPAATLRLCELEEKAEAGKDGAEREEATAEWEKAAGLRNDTERADAHRAGDTETANRGMGIADVAVSGQRIVDYQVVEQKLLYHLEETELDVLLKIVEAEAGGEDEEGKLLVANVVLNRLNSDKFPESVTEVVFQQSNGVTQFSPVANGSYYRAQVSEETERAVERALEGEDISEGALYFAARKYADSEKMKWFDSNLTFLFSHGGHEFFK